MNGHDGGHELDSVVVTGIGPVFLLEDLRVMWTLIGQNRLRE